MYNMISSKFQCKMLVIKNINNIIFIFFFILYYYYHQYYCNKIELSIKNCCMKFDVIMKKKNPKCQMFTNSLKGVEIF